MMPSNRKTTNVACAGNAFSQLIVCLAYSHVMIMASSHFSYFSLRKAKRAQAINNVHEYGEDFR